MNLRRKCETAIELLQEIGESLSFEGRKAIPLEGMSPEKANKLLHYCNREPVQFIQYDVFTYVEPGDPVVQPEDGDRDSLFCGVTTELMSGTTVRVLIVPDTPQETVARALKKISAWVEKNPEMLRLEEYQPIPEIASKFSRKAIW